MSEAQTSGTTAPTPADPKEKQQQQQQQQNAASTQNSKEAGKGEQCQKGERPPKKEKQQQQQKKKEKGEKQGEKQGQQQQQQQQQQGKKEKGESQGQGQGQGQGRKKQQQQQQGGGHDATAEDPNAVPMFAHLEQFRKYNWKFLESQHPSVVSAGMGISDMRILGSNARCVAMLTSIIDALKDYPVPARKDEVTPHMFKTGLLSHVNKIVQFFVSNRPLSPGMGNAVFELKRYISYELPDIVTKDFIEAYLYQDAGAAGGSSAGGRSLTPSQSPPPPDMALVIQQHQQKEKEREHEKFADQKNFGEQENKMITSLVTSQNDLMTSIITSTSSSSHSLSLSLSDTVTVTAAQPINDAATPVPPASSSPCDSNSNSNGNGEDEALKALVCAVIKSIRHFIYFRIYSAEKTLMSFSSQKIADDDVILTYGFSYSVAQSLIFARCHLNKNFKVVIIDSHPLFEGRRMLDDLSAVGIECTYALLSGLSYAMKPATKVMLGASALLKNGYGLARAGTALITTAAKGCHIPVIFCCESYKFTPKVQLDAIIYNQLGDPEAIANKDSRSYNADFDANKLPPKKSGFSTIFDSESEDDTKLTASVSDTSVRGNVAGRNNNNNNNSNSTGSTKQQQAVVVERRDIKLKPRKLKMLNVMLDVTPIENITMVICEHGCIPPTTVPVVIDEYLRYKNE